MVFNGHVLNMEWFREASCCSGLASPSITSVLLSKQFVLEAANNVVLCPALEDSNVMKILL